MTHIFLVYVGMLIILGIYTYYKRSDRLGIILVCAIQGIAIWNSCSILIELYATSIPVNLTSQLQLVSALVYINALYYFCALYPDKQKRLYNIPNVLVLAALLYAILFTEYVTHAELRDGAVYFIDGTGYTLYGIYFTLLYLSALYHLALNYRKFPAHRANITYLLLGVGVFLTFVVLFDIVLPIMGNYEYLVHGYLSSILAPVFFSYAITKHELLDIRVTVKRNTASIATTLIVAGTFFLTYFFTHDSGGYAVALIVGLGIFWGFYGLKLRDFLITTAKRKFVDGWYDAEKILTKLSDQLDIEQNRDAIFKVLCDNLDKTFQLENISLIIASRDEKNRFLGYSWAQKFLPMALEGQQKDPIIDFFKARSEAVQLKTSPRFVQDFFSGLGLEPAEAELAIPFFSPEMLEAIVILGERSIGVPFNDADMDFFKRLKSYISAILYRLTPFEKLEKQYFTNQKKLHEAEIQLIRAKKIEAIAHATRQCHHEIRTPLNIIQLAANRLKGIDDLDTFKVTVQDEIRRALVIMDETLTITDEYRSKRSIREKSLIDVNQAIRRCLKLVPEQGYRVNSVLAGLPKIWGHMHDLEIVFTNLVNNALTAMPSGGKLTITSYVEFHQIIVEVSDTGTGVPDSIRHSIWEPYTSGHRVGTGNENAGRGWGLTIVHRIICDHDGTISFESREGEGTTFKMCLPMAEKLQEVEAAKKDESHSSEKSLDRGQADPGLS